MRRRKREMRIREARRRIEIERLKKSKGHIFRSREYLRARNTASRVGIHGLLWKVHRDIQAMIKKFGFSKE
jgi:hypothetical protein|nr:MAG TPA: hypothetical protein [Caudoviricetes sp.]